MANTTNFGWETPDDTDLVKDGAAAMRTLGNSIDASFVDLKGGTTGQVLAKASNTDLDFNWIAVDPLTILDAKGDLISATAADTPARLAVGTNGQVLVANSSTSTGLEWQSLSSGGYTLLTSGSHSGNTLSITSIPNTYKELVIFLDGYDPTDDGDNMRMRFNQDSTANRHYASLLTNYVDTQAFNATSVDISRANDNTVTTNNIVVRIPNYATTAGWKRGEAYSITVSETTTTSMRAAWYGLYYNQTTAISSLDFITSGANSFAINYKVYGVA